jgi:hypothetical protein
MYHDSFKDAPDRIQNWKGKLQMFIKDPEGFWEKRKNFGFNKIQNLSDDYNTKQNFKDILTNLEDYFYRESPNSKLNLTAHGYYDKFFEECGGINIIN